MRELAGYTEELRKNRDKVAELRNIEGCDPARIRQWVSVAAETEAMIPDTANRLANAVQDLRNFLVRSSSSCSGLAPPGSFPFHLDNSSCTGQGEGGQIHLRPPGTSGSRRSSRCSRKRHSRTVIQISLFNHPTSESDILVKATRSERPQGQSYDACEVSTASARQVSPTLLLSSVPV
mmetsp:Transcript_553/g.1094  ORF Transcript_553/g.1094 Transcript_553/m.1094 type:complete len:178 (-) Transcript_553:1217-1750(-)